MHDLFIIKIGGNIIDNPSALQQFLENFAAIDGLKVLVHGGGKIASKIGEQLGIAPNYVQGRRITDDATIDLVTMVYGGLVNKRITAQLQVLQCKALGLTGADANILPAVKRPVKDIDFGWVGDVDSKHVNTKLLSLLLDSGCVPVLAPLTHDGHGHILNTNADTIASCLAIALSATYNVRLVYCFEKQGILEDITNEQSVVPHINKALYKQLLAENKLFEGILPKLENAFAAIDAGVHEVLIGHAKDIVQHAGNNTPGTLITA